MPDVSPRAEPGNLHDELCMLEQRRPVPDFHDAVASEEQFESFLEKIGGEDTFHE